jgi:hypothetical protein
MLQNFPPKKQHAKCLTTYFLDYEETVANPDPEVRSCGRVQNAFQLPLPTRKKLRVNCPVLYNVAIIIIIIIIIINENMSSHETHYLQKTKSNLKFLPDIFSSFEMKFRSPIY